MVRALLTAITSHDGEDHIYWRESDDSTVFRAYTVSWSPSSSITPLASGYGFAANEMSDGGQIGPYYRRCGHFRVATIVRPGPQVRLK